MNGWTVQAQAATTPSVDTTVKLKPTEASTFNDTNNDGLGEFQGWGTSLCWWANMCGKWSDDKIDRITYKWYVDKVFKDYFH